MRNLTCILTSEAKTRTEKNVRDMIIDAVMVMFFDTESDSVKVIVLTELYRQIKELQECSELSTGDKKDLEKLEKVWKYMLSHNIDVIVVDDMTEVPE